MPSNISNHIPIKQTNKQHAFQSNQKLKTDRRFQAFVDEALKQQEIAQQTKAFTSDIQVSNHAQKRMEQRGIELDQEDFFQIEEAFSALSEKGAENSLILYDDLSLIASIKNKTIITASTTDEMQEVTNIDSAIHIKTK